MWPPASATTSSIDKPVKAASKTAANSSFGANMPLMSSAFDTAMWLTRRVAAAPSRAPARSGLLPPPTPPSGREGPTPSGSPVSAAASRRYSSTDTSSARRCRSKSPVAPRSASQRPRVWRSSLRRCEKATVTSSPSSVGSTPGGCRLAASSARPPSRRAAADRRPPGRRRAATRCRSATAASRSAGRSPCGRARPPCGRRLPSAA